jgi:ATP-dependent Clp protease ATP-binding subunit ClpA
MTSNLGSANILDGSMERQAVRDAVMGAVRGHFRPEFINRVDELIIFDPLARDQVKSIVRLQVRGCCGGGRLRWQRQQRRRRRAAACGCLPPAGGCLLRSLCPKATRPARLTASPLPAPPARPPRAQVARVAQRLAERKIRLEVSEEAIDFLVGAGFDPVYGARPVKRAVQRELETGLAKALLRGEFGDEDTVVVGAGERGLTFSRGAKVGAPSDGVLAGAAR